MFKATFADNSNNTNNRKRSVRFCSENKVRFIDSHNDMSEEERDAVWFTEKEKKMMEYSLMKTIKSFRKNGAASQRCIRGLEHMISPEHLEQRNANKECAIVVVINEQNRQRSLRIRDPVVMKNLSEATSQWSRDLALKAGAADASEAQTYLADLRNQMRTSTSRFCSTDSGKYDLLLEGECNFTEGVGKKQQEILFSRSGSAVGWYQSASPFGYNAITENLSTKISQICIRHQ